MAGRKPKISIDEKINKAEEALMKSKTKYDADAAVLKDLLHKKEAARNKELLDAVSNSSRSFEEIMDFLKSNSAEDE